MSRSKRKAIVKDKGLKCLYHKTCRRVIKQSIKRFLKEDPDIIAIPNPKEIMNDYDYSDYTIDYEYSSWNNTSNSSHNDWVEKIRRK